MTPAEQRRAWSRDYIRKAPDAPAYGSPEWLALPNGPEKVAAVVRAAECWARDGDDLEHRLRDELALAQQVEKAREDAEWAHAGAHWMVSRQAIAADVEREWREWVGRGAA